MGGLGPDVTTFRAASEPPESGEPKEVKVINATTKGRLLIIGAIGTLVTSLAGVTLGIVQALKPPAVTTATGEAVYDVQNKRIDKVAEQCAKVADISDQRWNYVLGRLESTPSVSVSPAAPGSSKQIVVLSPAGKEEKAPMPPPTMKRPEAPAAPSFDALAK